MTSLWLILVIRCPCPSPVSLSWLPTNHSLKISQYWWRSLGSLWSHLLIAHFYPIYGSSLLPLRFLFGSLLPKASYYPWLPFKTIMAFFFIPFAWLPSTHCSFLAIFFPLGLYTTLGSLLAPLWLYGSLWLPSPGSLWLPFSIEVVNNFRRTVARRHP